MNQGVLGLILIAAVAIIGVSALAPKIGVAAPLLLVITGFALSHIMGLPEIPEIDPEIIFIGVIPPLLYATAVNVPTIDLRRNIGSIMGLSVLLVLATSVIFGLVLHLWLPGLGLPAGIAAGAMLSPTGSVSTMISKKVRAPHRLVTMLEGEGLLNDATALVVMRAAIAATAAASISLPYITLNFLWLIIGGVVVGILIGAAGIWLRRLIKLPELTTALTFVVPFAAFLATEAIGASGEVGVVITGLLTGWAGRRFLEPQDRQYGQYNWLTIATMLEGALFFFMGLSISTILGDTRMVLDEVHRVGLLAALSGAILLTVRAIFVFPLIEIMNRTRLRSRRVSRHLHSRLPQKIQELTFTQTRASEIGPAHSNALRRIADADYRQREHIGKRVGIAILWSGMRGAVTIAAAQTLPWDFPFRSFLILLAAVVSAGTLLIQGFTLPILLKRLSLVNNRQYDPSHIRAIRTILKESSSHLLADPQLTAESGSHYDNDILAEVKDTLEHEPSLLFIEEKIDEAEQLDKEIDKNQDQAWTRLHQYLELRRRVYEHQHATLLDTLSLGTHDSDAIGRVFDALDAEQMAVELRLDSVEAAQ